MATKNEIFNNKKKRRRRRKKKNNHLKIGIACLGIVALVFVGTKILNKDYNIKAADGNEQYELAVNKPNPKPLDIVPGFNVTYEGLQYAMDAHDVKQMLNGKHESDEKYAFLTFDDGPSPVTEKILDVLKEKDVKGTFFILGSRLDEVPETQKILRRTIEEGNAIANHTYSHNYGKLYPGNYTNVDTFMSEIEKANDTMRNALGDNFDTRVVRMPGGYNSRVYYKDPNLTELNKRFEQEDIVELDWNALNGDAEGKPYTPDEMVDYLKRTVAGQKHVIILMHDTYGKDKTAQTLPEIIDYLKTEGYQFKTIK